MVLGGMGCVHTPDCVMTHDVWDRAVAEFSRVMKRLREVSRGGKRPWKRTPFQRWDWSSLLPSLRLQLLWGGCADVQPFSSPPPHFFVMEGNLGPFSSSLSKQFPSASSRDLLTAKSRSTLVLWWNSSVPWGLWYDHMCPSWTFLTQAVVRLSPRVLTGLVWLLLSPLLWVTLHWNVWTPLKI